MFPLQSLFDNVRVSVCVCARACLFVSHIHSGNKHLGTAHSICNHAEH